LLESTSLSDFSLYQRERDGRAFVASPPVVPLKPEHQGKPFGRLMPQKGMDEPEDVEAECK
jgi:hypothetical protein